MSNQEIEKQTFQDYLTAVFDSENLTISTCNTYDDFDFKAALDPSLAAFRRKCRTILNRQAPIQGQKILEPGQIRFRALGNYLNKLQQQDIQNQSPEIVGIIENMTDLMNQMVDIDSDLNSLYTEESDNAMAEEAKTKLEKDITVYLNNYLNTLEEEQRDSLIRRIKKFRAKMKKRTDHKTTQDQKQPGRTTTTSNTTSLLMRRPPGPLTSGDRRRRKRTNSNSSSTTRQGLNNDSLSSVLTNSSSQPNLQGVSSLEQQTNNVADILGKPLFDFNDPQLEKQLQELMRKSEIETSSSSLDPVSKQTDIGTGEGGPKTGQETSSTVPTSFSMVNIFNDKKNSSNVATSSTTSSTKSRNSTINSSNSPYIDIDKIDNSSMQDLDTYLRQTPERENTDFIVNKVIPNITKYKQELRGTDRTSKLTKKQKASLLLFIKYKQELVNQLGMYINLAVDKNGQMTNIPRTANEIRTIIYKPQYKPQAKR